jgi:ABC-type branched-subunit amino acid transport system ATPase component
MRRSIQTGHSEIKVKVREDIKDWILEEERELFEELTVQHNIRIEFVASELSVHALHEAPFEVLSSGS